MKSSRITNIIGRAYAFCRGYRGIFAPCKGCRFYYTGDKGCRWAWVCCDWDCDWGNN